MTVLVGAEEPLEESRSFFLGNSQPVVAHFDNRLGLRAIIGDVILARISTQRFSLAGSEYLIAFAIRFERHSSMAAALTSTAGKSDASLISTPRERAASRSCRATSAAAWGSAMCRERRNILPHPRELNEILQRDFHGFGVA